MLASALLHFRDTRPVVAAVAALAAAVLFNLVSPSPARAGFGDSTWVAPGTPPDEEPADPGPRVAEPDHERTWETVLRTPFRVAFFPLRLLARGLEAGASVVERRRPPGNARGPAERPGLRIGPTFSYSGAAGPGAGLSVSSGDFLGGQFNASGTWSLKDNRRVRVRVATAEGSQDIGLGVEGVYDYRPNRRFYGMGNDPPGERTIYLRRDDTVEGWLRLGHDPYRRVRALVGYSDIRVGNGYSGSGSRHTWDVFSDAEVPFLHRGSDVWSYGAAADLAALNSVREPSHGVHLRGEARQVTSTDGANLDYVSARAEARGYLPVFASRRVIALRLVGRTVNEAAGSEPVPFYRLPESSLEDRFAGYSSGRFRDRRLAVAHIEYRWLIWERLWAVALAQRGIVAHRTDALRYADMHESYGGGFRIRMSETRSARLEIAKGSDGVNVYLDLKGDF